MINDTLVDFSDLVKNIPVGVCKILLDGKFTLIYANRFFYSLYGYTTQQLQDELGNEMVRAVFPEEREDVIRIFTPLKYPAADFKIEHRITRRDGTQIWLLVSGNYTTHKDEPAANCVVVDITDRKQMEEKLRIDEERFRLALAQTENTIFDYDISTKIMMHAGKAADAYGLADKTVNVPESIIEAGLIHPDSISDYLEMYRSIHTGAKSAFCVVRAKLLGGRYAWRRITMTNIFDNDGKAVKAVGMLEDIDEQMRREEALRERSRRDTLTGLYNKGTTESMVRDMLKSSTGQGALFIIDIDNFKGVNDNYGHPFGDAVLVEFANRIARLCRCSDVIGRIGGDEILIYLDGVLNIDTAINKGEEICDSFSKEFSSGNASVIVTCTVGISIYPDCASSFEELYKKADIALYFAKNKGKNCSCIYNSDMGSLGNGAVCMGTAIDEPEQLSII